MVARQMMDVHKFDGGGFSRLVQFEGWTVAFLRYNERFSAFTTLERHTETDEVFVLLEGEAELFIGKEERVKMEKNTVYNIHKNVWHHIVVSKDATVLVVENSNTTAENTERVMVSDYR